MSEMHIYNGFLGVSDMRIEALKKNRTFSYHSWFEDYVNQLHSSEPEIQRNIELKLEHTLRVCENIAMIAGSLNLNREDLFLAETIALFHDIGRFEQIKRYKTFRDLASIDHASLGLRVLSRYGILSNLTERERDTILRAISLHNKYEIPENELPDGILFSRLIRDADKLDILYVMTNYYGKRIQQQDPILDLELPDKPGFSPEVVHDLMSCKMVNVAHLKNLNDMKLMYLSWIFDINFPMTMSHILDARYLEKLISSLPYNEEMRRIDDHIYIYLKSRRQIQV